VTLGQGDPLPIFDAKRSAVVGDGFLNIRDGEPDMVNARKHMFLTWDDQHSGHIIPRLRNIPASWRL
jgi:hypothetical protein